MKKNLAILVALALLLMSVSGCTSANSSSTASSSTSQSTGSAKNDVSSSASKTTAATKAGTDAKTDSVTDYKDAAAIVLGNTITVSGKGASVSGNTVNITAGGSYTISGTLANGMVDVNTTEKVFIELNGVSITNASGPAICFTNAKKATITLKAGTTNTLTDAVSDNENDAVLFSNDTLVLEGEGTLIVTGNNLEGIASDDDIIINGGIIKVTAPDDGLNAHDDITINGGYVYVASLGDGIDSNGTLNINGGTVISMSGLTDANGGLDADGEITITGGTVIATGSRLSMPGTSSSQKSLLITFTGTQKANQLVCIKQADNTLLTFAPAQNYQQFFYSSAAVSEGVSYDAYAGGSATGSAVDGLYSGSTYTAGTLNSTVTTSSIENANANGFGGGPGGGQQPVGPRK